MGEGRKRMEFTNRVVLLTISMVVLAGILSAGAAFLHTRRVSDAYDLAIKAELEEKAIAYGETALAFLNAAGPNAFAVVEEVVSDTQRAGDGDTPEAESGSDTGFANAFLSFEVWVRDASSPDGFQLASKEDFADNPTSRQEEVVTDVLERSIDTELAAAAVDEENQLIFVAVPLGLNDETSVVVMGTLSAEEEFAFFAAQRQGAIRNGVLISIGIVLVVGLVGAFLSVIVSRELSKSHVRLRAKSALLERALAEEQERGRRDSLTGTLNHAAIVEELASLVHDRCEDGSLAVAMVDVDGLKTTNDIFGHHMGDAVLVAVARELSVDNAIIGRYGGDEFIALLPDTDRMAAERYRSAVLDKLASSPLTDPESGAMVPVAASIGIAVFPQEAETVGDLMLLADSAMYADKRERPVASTGRPWSEPLGRELAAKMADEITPLLTSRADLKDKLRLVADRLSIGSGYDGVNFMLYAPTLSEAPLTGTRFGQVSHERAESWIHEHGKLSDDPLRQTLERIRRPIFMEDPQHDQRITEGERKFVRAAAVRTVLIVPITWKDELLGSLSVISKREAAFGPQDADFVGTIAARTAPIVRMATLVEELRATSDRLAESRTDTVMLLAASAEAHDHTTGLHLQNVRALAEALALELGYDVVDSKDLGLAAVLHDIGKIRVPELILKKAGKLADEEWKLIQRHTSWGAEFLAGRPGFELAATIARSHHERSDGSGYPDGLAGETIPEAAAIVAVADAIDAMTSDRPYREARPVDEAVREIVAHSGRQFNPRVVEALVEIHKRSAITSSHMLADGERAAA